MPHVMTTCPFCGCGCGLYLQVAGDGVVGVSASPAHPVSSGRLCIKGWHAHELASTSRRIQRPLVRRGRDLEECSWDEALELVAGKLGEIRAESGPGAVGVLGSARHTNEDNFLLGKLARCCLATNSIDFSARLEALPGLFDLPRYRPLTMCQAGLADIERADLVLLWQADPVQEHPAAAARVIRALERGVPLIEVKARAGQLGKLACLQLHPRPGSEVRLAAGLLHAAMSLMEVAEANTIAASVSECTPEWTELNTGVPASAVAKAGEALAKAARPLVLCSGAATLGAQGGELLLSLSALGQLKPDDPEWGHLLWLSRYCNSQGARDMGVVPYFLPGYQPVSDPAARRRFEEAWGRPLPAEPGLPAWDLLGQARALYVMGDDPMAVLPDAAATRQALAELDFLVVHDTFPSETMQFAHVVLPGASFAEKDGTFTSAERRVQRVRRAAALPGECRADSEILCEVARRMGYPASYGSAADIMAEIAALVPSYAGVSHEALEVAVGARWPRAEALAELGDQGRPEAETVSVGLENGPETDQEFPLVLVADHALEPWSDDAAAACCVSLRRELQGGRPNPLPSLEMSRAAAIEQGLRDSEKVRVRSRTGEMEAALRLTDETCRSVLVLPFRMREAAARVMPAGRHPETGVPVLRPCAVCIEKL